VPHTYEFRFEGQLSATVRAELHELDLEDGPERTETVMIGRVPDTAALNGLLRRFELLGIDVIEVHRSPEQDQDSSSS
jgi:hypothetical protein